MNYYVENMFGFGRYQISGENAKIASEEFTLQIEKINDMVFVNPDFEIENKLTGEMENAIASLISKYQVEIKLAFDI